MLSLYDFGTTSWGNRFNVSHMDALLTTAFLARTNCSKHLLYQLIKNKEILVHESTVPVLGQTATHMCEEQSRKESKEKRWRYLYVVPQACPNTLPKRKPKPNQASQTQP